MLRIDTVNHIGPFRLNVWTSIILFVLATVYFLRTHRSSGDTADADAESSPAGGPETE
jgi:hypothetical protein